MGFNIKQGDTSPSLRVKLKNSDQSAADLTGATVRFHMREVDATVASVDALATIVNATGGEAQYDWVTGDTNTAGSFYGEFEVTFSDGSIGTYPNDGYLDISISEELA